MTTLTVDNWALHELTLDFADQFVADTLIANAADARGRGINLFVTKDGQPLSMPNMKVYLLWRHDQKGTQGQTQFTTVNATNGNYKVYYPAGMMYEGTVTARISIYVGSTTPITGSRDFRINVERNPINEGDAMASDDFSAFIQATIDLNELNDSITAAEAARVTAESGRASAESTRVSNENTRKSNETTRQSNETARKSAETARANAETSRASAESSRVTAEQGRVTAEQDRASAESARVSEFATLKSQSQAATSNATSAAAAANTAAENANAAAAATANVVAEAVEALSHETGSEAAQINVLAIEVTRLKDGYVVIGETLYTPASRATVSGEAITRNNATVSGEKITLN